jgi:hypothetical protein
VLPAGILEELARQYPDISVSMLGPWAGAWALRNGKRVIYSPYLSGISDVDWELLQWDEEMAEFQSSNADLMPDHRFYPSVFGMQPGQAYRLPG